MFNHEKLDEIENKEVDETVRLDELDFAEEFKKTEEATEESLKDKKFSLKKKSLKSKRRSSNPAADARRAKKKEEKLEKRRQKKHDKEIKKAKKINEKLHRKEVEKLNRRLRVVSRKTFNNLGIVSFDTKAGTIRKAENQWIKTYKIEGMNDDNRDEFIDQLTRFLSIRARISTNLSLAESDRLIRTDYITFFVDGEDYESIKNKLDVEVKMLCNIRPEINMVEISLNTIMNQIRHNFIFEGPEVDFEMLTRRKSNWKLDAFGEIVVKDDFFATNDKIGACLQVIQYPDAIDQNLLSELLKINKPIMFVTEIQPVSDETNNDFKRIIERRFNKELEGFENCFINIGFTVVIITETKELNKKVIDSVERLFCNKKMVISPVYGNTADVLESCFSYGIKDYHSMRNIPVSEVKRLVL